MSFGSRKETAKNIIEDKKYRDFYTETHLKKNVPFQMKTMRIERDWSQTFAAEEILGKGQNALSRLESPAYGRLTLQTLSEIAKAYDVGLIVKFVPYSRLLKEYEDVSYDALSAPSPTEKFKDEIEAIWKWADEKEDGGFWEEDSENETVSNEVKKPSEYAANLITNTFPTASAAQTSIEWNNANELKVNDIDYLQQPKTNPTQLRKTVGALS